MATKEAKSRKPNFSEKEKLLLLSEWENRENVLKPRFSSKITSQVKHNAWQEIADALNAQFPSVRRDVAELQKKWQNMNSKMKEEASKHRKESKITGGGPAPPDLSPLDQRLMVLLGENSPTIVGISGGIDSLATTQLGPPDEAAVATADADGYVAARPDECIHVADESLSNAVKIPSSESQHRQKSMTGSRKRTRTEGSDEEYIKLLVLEQKRSEAETRRAEAEVEKIELKKQMKTLQIALLQNSFHQ